MAAKVWGISKTTAEQRDKDVAHYLLCYTHRYRAIPAIRKFNDAFGIAARLYERLWRPCSSAKASLLDATAMNGRSCRYVCLRDFTKGKNFT